MFMDNYKLFFPLTLKWTKTWIWTWTVMYSTEGIQTQTELSSYLHAASFASLNDEMNNIFGYMKSR
jgi:hypothetical protein